MVNRALRIVLKFVKPSKWEIRAHRTKSMILCSRVRYSKIWCIVLEHEFRMYRICVRRNGLQIIHSRTIALFWFDAVIKNDGKLGHMNEITHNGTGCCSRHIWIEVRIIILVQTCPWANSRALYSRSHFRWWDFWCCGTMDFLRFFMCGFKSTSNAVKQNFITRFYQSHHGASFVFTGSLVKSIWIANKFSFCFTTSI